MSLDSNAGLVSAPLWSKIAALKLACPVIGSQQVTVYRGCGPTPHGGILRVFGAGDDQLPYNEAKTCLTALARE